MASNDTHGQIASWSALMDWLERYKEKNWLFRGEPDPTYSSLKPRVGRVSRAIGAVRKVE
jgi:hypothetical protein